MGWTRAPGENFVQIENESSWLCNANAVRRGAPEGPTDVRLSASIEESSTTEKKDDDNDEEDGRGAHGPPILPEPHPGAWAPPYLPTMRRLDSRFCPLAAEVGGSSTTALTAHAKVAPTAFTWGTRTPRDTARRCCRPFRSSSTTVS